MWILVLAAAGVLALAGVALVRARRAPTRAELGWPRELDGAVANVAVATLTLAGVEGAVRLIARRPQPAASLEQVAIDDALRSTSAHAVVGAGWAVTLLCPADQLAVTPGAQSRAVAWTLPWVAVACVGAAIASWLHAGHPRGRAARRGLAGGRP